MTRHPALTELARTLVAKAALVPTKRTVTQNGRTFQRTYWTKPGATPEPQGGAPTADANEAPITLIAPEEEGGRRYNTLNGIEDPGKLKRLTASMRRDGWLGAPLVRWGESDLITGSHRYYAAQAANVPIPVVDLEDVFEEAGLDFMTAWREEDEPAYGEYGMGALLQQLPDAIIEKYGIDYDP